MFSALISIVILLLFIALSTLAMVLMARFTLGKRSADTRIIAAGISGPGWVIGPFLLFFAAADRLGNVEALVMIALLFAGFIVVGWPISYFATRRLDRLIQPDTAIFE